jgi:hypothetical protein
MTTTAEAPPRQMPVFRPGCVGVKQDRFIGRSLRVTLPEGTNKEDLRNPDFLGKLNDLIGSLGGPLKPLDDELEFVAPDKTWVATCRVSDAIGKQVWVTDPVITTIAAYARIKYSDEDYCIAVCPSDGSLRTYRNSNRASPLTKPAASMQEAEIHFEQFTGHKPKSAA